MLPVIPGEGARLVVDKDLKGTLLLFVITLVELFELATRDTPPVAFTLEVQSYSGR